MLKTIIAMKLAAFEKQWDYPTDYMREILELGVRPIKKFFYAQAIGEYREGLPVSAHYTAKLLGVMAGDCGPCVQLVVNMASADGVDEAALAALVAGDFESLPEEMKLSAEFTRALLARTAQLPELRERMRKRYGNAGLVSIAYGVINASMFPILKYALGHGHACAKIEVGGREVIPVSPLSPTPLDQVA